MTAKKKKKIKKRYTLKEFKAWLQGIEEIQPDDWHPDLDQWKLIRERIDNIVAEVQEKVVEREVEVPANAPPGPPMGPPPMGPPPAPNPPMPPSNAAPIPPVPSSIPDTPEVEMSEAARRALQGELPKGDSGVPPASGPVHKLPTDPAASDPNAPGKPYASSFV